MSDLINPAARRTSGHESESWSDRFSPARWEEQLEETTGLSPGWTIAGIAIIALGAFAVYHFGPDFRRYLKIERM